MRPSRRRRQANRVSRFESMEPRWFLSADPVADFRVDYFVDNQLYDEIYTTLAEAHDLTGLTEARAEYGLTGSGQTVAIIDTGIAYDHTALGGGFGPEYRVVGGFDFSGERDADPYDDGPYGSHGTHVAGIIASNDAVVPGVAPEVDLVGLRVFDDDGRGYFDRVEEALQWVHDHRNDFENPITTVNLSLGTRENSAGLPFWAELEDEFAQLEADGIFVAVAAGNSFTRFEQPGLSYPAVSLHVVPVASVDRDGSLSYFSQRDSRVIAAPGRSVLSSVPDYMGNRDGISDDFARFSGTSMAAPYVAGAAVLLRQAYEFAGTAPVTQEIIYDLMYATADTLYDPLTEQTYRRLNLGRAIDAVMPPDDFGSTEAAAYDLGTLAGTRSLAGTIGSLADRDWFSFIAGVTGSATVEIDAGGELVPAWQWSAAAGEPADLSNHGISFDVVAGRTYAVGLAGGGGLGHYTLELGIEVGVTDSDWGVVSQQYFDGNRIDVDGQWFTFIAGSRGTLTTEAIFTHADGDVDLQLFDADRRLVGASYGTTGRERIDVAASPGDVFHLRAYIYGSGVNDGVDFRVTNLVSQDGGLVRVRGTGGDDRFRFTAGTTHEIVVNEVAYRFESAVVSSFSFDGRGGFDTAVLTGSGGNDRAVLRPGSAELSGPGYRVRTVAVETTTVRSGGGSDTVEFYDSPGEDAFSAWLGGAMMTGEGFENRAAGFETVEAYATAGGTDVAKLFDSPGDDTFVATPRYATLFGDGFYRRVEGFESVHAYATAGGTDVAKLFDSPGNDRFVAGPLQGALYGDGFYNRAKHFESVHAYATAGGTDVAKLFDSPGNDRFVAGPIQGALYGDGFYNRAKHFEEVHAYGGGGFDVAILRYASSVDTFVSNETYSAAYGNGFYNRAKHFEQVHAQGDVLAAGPVSAHDASPKENLQRPIAWSALPADASATWFYLFDEYLRTQSAHERTHKTEHSVVDYILQREGDWR